MQAIGQTTRSHRSRFNASNLRLLHLPGNPEPESKPAEDDGVVNKVGSSKNVIPEIYTVNETAKIMKKKPVTIYRWINLGMLQAVRPNQKTTLVTSVAINRFLTKFKTTAVNA